MPSFAQSRRPARRAGAFAVRRPVVVLLLVVTTALGLLAVRTTQAAFKSRASSGPASITAGTVSLSRSTSGAVFAETGLKRGDSRSACVVITYNGSLAALVRVYTSAPSGGLGDFLGVTVEEGSGGSAASCSGFTPATTTFSGSLSQLASSATNYASGVGAFAPTGSGQARTYRITTTVSQALPIALSSQTAGITLHWEAHNT